MERVMTAREATEHRQAQRAARAQMWRSPSGLLAGLRPLALPAALVVALVGIVAWVTSASLLKGAMASGADTGSYLLTTRFLVDSWLANGTLPAINPAWYLGFEVLHNTPLPIYALLAPIYYVTRDAVATSHAAHYLLAVFAALAAFVALRRRLGDFGAAAAAAFFTCSPIVFGQIVLGGSYPRSLATSIAVLAFPLVERLAEEGPGHGRVAGTSILLALSITTHPVTGAAFAMAWALYVVFHMSVARSWRTSKLGGLFVALTMSGVLSAWYLLPYFAERQGWTEFPYEIYLMSSLKTAEAVGWIGWTLIALAGLGVLLTADRPDVRAHLLLAGTNWLLAAGAYAGIHKFAPILQAFYPFVFLFVSSFSISALAGSAVAWATDRIGPAGGCSRDDESASRLPCVEEEETDEYPGPGDDETAADLSHGHVPGGSRLGATLVLAAAAVAAFATLSHAHALSQGGAASSASYTNRHDIDAAAAVARSENPGRVMVMRYPFSFINYWLLGYSGKPGVEGWYYSLTQSGKHIAWLYDAVDHGFMDYAVRAMERWDVRHFVTNGNYRGARYEEFAERLFDRGGYRRVYQGGSNAVWVSDAPSSYASPIHERTLVVGRYAPSVTMMLPDAVTGGSPALDDYDAETLACFDTLVLYGFSMRDRKTCERNVRAFAERGGTVVVDLLGMEREMTSENAFFLGVTGVDRIGPSGLRAKTVGSVAASSAVFPASLPLPVRKVLTDEEVRDWRYTSYLGLDRSAAVEAEAPAFVLLGEKTVGSGTVTFVGGNLFYHAFLTLEESELAAVRALARPRVKRAPARAAVKGLESYESEHMRFSYTAEEPGLLVISTTASKHWVARQDDRVVPTINIEDLVAIRTRPGTHSVALDYGGYPTHGWAWALTGAGGLWVVLGFVGAARRRMPEDHASDPAAEGASELIDESRDFAAADPGSAGQAAASDQGDGVDAGASERDPDAEAHRDRRPAIVADWLEDEPWGGDVMRVLLVNPPAVGDLKCVREGRCEQRVSSFQYLMVPISLPSTAAVLRQGGHEVAVLDCIADDIAVDGLLEHVAAFEPGLVITNVSTVTFDADAEVARALRAVSHVHVAAIGVHVTTMPDLAIQTGGWDSVVRREPELTVLALADALASGAGLAGVEGLSYLDADGTVRHNPDRPLISDLDALPFPARDLMHNDRYLAPVSDKTQTLVITGRGCPHACIYCTAHCYYGSRVRTRSATSIVDEVAECVEEHGIQVITMWADTFTMDRDQVLAVCDELARRDLHVEWMCNSRVDTVDAELLRRMGAAGCSTMSYGVESGAQEILDNIRKGTTLHQVRDAFRWTREAGIESAAHVIFGLPGETTDTIAATERFIREIEPDYVQFYCAVPFPGTRFYELSQEAGWITTDDWSRFEINQAIVSTPDLSDSALDAARRRAYRGFYLRPGYVLRKLHRAGSPKAAFRLVRRGVDFMKDWVRVR